MRFIIDIYTLPRHNTLTIIQSVTVIQFTLVGQRPNSVTPRACPHSVPRMFSDHLNGHSCLNGHFPAPSKWPRAQRELTRAPDVVHSADTISHSADTFSHSADTISQTADTISQTADSLSQSAWRHCEWLVKSSISDVYVFPMYEWVFPFYFLCVCTCFLSDIFLLVSYIAKEVIPPYSFVSTLVLYSVFITLFCRYYFVSLWVSLNTIRHKLRTFSPVHLLLSTVVFYIFPYRFIFSFLFLSFSLYYFYVFSS